MTQRSGSNTHGRTSRSICFSVGEAFLEKGLAVVKQTGGRIALIRLPVSLKVKGVYIRKYFTVFSFKPIHSDLSNWHESAW